MADARRYYVITATGEIGPYTPAILREELLAKRIQASDRLRNAFGTNAGTVGDLLGSSGRESRTPQGSRQIGDQAAHRQSDRQRAVASSNGSRQISGRMSATRQSDRTRPIATPRRDGQPNILLTPPVILLAVVAIGALAVSFNVVLSRPSRDAEASPPAAKPPVIESSPAATAIPAAVPAAVPEAERSSPLRLVQLKPSTDVAVATAPSAAPPTVNPPPAPSAAPGIRRPCNNQPQRIPGPLALERFDEGGEGVAYHDTDAENHGNFKLRSNEGVDMNIGTVRNSAALGWVRNGEWIEYSCQVESAGRYTWSLAANRDSNQTLSTMTIEWRSDGKSLGPAIAIENHQRGPFTSTVDLPAGPQVLRLCFTGDVINITGISFAADPR